MKYWDEITIIKVLALFLILVFIANGCIVPRSTGIDLEEKDNFYDVVTEYYIQDAVNVRYPQIQGLGDSIREQAINELIRNDLFETEINEQLREVEYVIDNYGVDEKYYLELDYEITMCTEKIFSVIYTGNGAFKTSAFSTYAIYAITVDLELVTIMKLSDFINVDSSLVEKMKSSTEVTNGAVKNGMDNETLLRVIQTDIEEKEESIIRCLSRMSGGYCTFAVSPDSLFISISIVHALGSYALIKIPYVHKDDNSEANSSAD